MPHLYSFVASRDIDDYYYYYGLGGGRYLTAKTENIDLLVSRHLDEQAYCWQLERVEKIR